VRGCPQSCYESRLEAWQEVPTSVRVSPAALRHMPPGTRTGARTALARPCARSHPRIRQGDQIPTAGTSRPMRADHSCHCVRRPEHHPPSRSESRRPRRNSVRYPVNAGQHIRRTLVTATPCSLSSSFRRSRVPLGNGMKVEQYQGDFAGPLAIVLRCGHEKE
jgi:hypothetical protein